MEGPDLKKKIREIMTTRIVAATKDYNVRDLAVLLQSGTFSGIPIVEPGNRLVGMVTEFDLMKALTTSQDLHTLKAEAIMSTPPISIGEHQPIKEAMDLMMALGIIRLPVVRDEKLIGLISRSDILNHTIDSHIVNIYGG
jgi:CBS domain-containing protein